MNKRLVALALVILALLITMGVFFRDQLSSFLFTPTETSLEQGASSEEDHTPAIESIAEELYIPWSIAFLPSGDILITERGGTLQRLGENGSAIDIEGVEHAGEGGLLGLTLHPEFSNNQWLYLYRTTQTDEGLTNTVERYKYTGNELSERTTIIDSIPGANYHDGGRLAFGPDGLLYITTGDAGNEDNAQDLESLAGKILRLEEDGSIPADNPFDTAIYSFGHRNPQGIAWDGQGNLWSTEHGRSGVQSGYDELNRIEPGVNYGWPIIQGDISREGLRPPVVHSGANETWAPAGMVFHNGSFFFAGLRGESLYEAKLNEDGTVELTAHLRGDYGRLRAVALGSDNYLYVATSNTDGRGHPQDGDDRIIKINPKIFE